MISNWNGDIPWNSQWHHFNEINIKRCPIYTDGKKKRYKLEYWQSQEGHRRTLCKCKCGVSVKVLQKYVKFKQSRSHVWNAKLTETRIFRELSIEIESSLIELKSCLIKIRELFNSIRELFNSIIELSIYV